MTRIASILLLGVIACGPSTSGGGGPDGGGGGDGAAGPDAPATSTTLDPAKCAAFAQSFADAAMTCGTSLPAGAQTAFEGWCRKGVTAAAMCGGNPAGGLDCFAHEDPNDWVCRLGEPYPQCGGDLASALGALCLIAQGNPSCASGIHCSYDADCSNGYACNSATHQCFRQGAYCIGLPCGYDADCPTNEICNSAEHACIGK